MRTIHCGFERTSEQDPKYPIRLLVDIAIKALSPAINDPTTAVQAIDQIEDLLRRLGGHDLDAGYARDANGVLRLIFLMPVWKDLVLAFDEIRHYGADSVQVMRRLRSALVGVTDSVTADTRIGAVQRYLKQLDLTVDRSDLAADDQETARQEDRQGLGLPRRQGNSSRSEMSARGICVDFGMSTARQLRGCRLNPVVRDWKRTPAHPSSHPSDSLTIH